MSVHAQPLSDLAWVEGTAQAGTLPAVPAIVVAAQEIRWTRGDNRNR